MERASKRRPCAVRATMERVRECTALKGRYELTRVVGHGGMAEVWAAHDLAGAGLVAVKTVAVGDQPERAHQLRREAQLAATVHHPGVIDVRDVGVDRGTAFLVMDLLRGRDLSALLRGGALPLPDALWVGAEVAGALDATHRAGVVHRDVKPANVVVGEDGVTLIDFGVAAAGEARSAGRLTFGTAQYMAPEQVSGAPVGPAADMYSFGCLLTAIVAGRPPFLGDHPVELLRRHARAVPPRLAELAPGVPADLDSLVARLLAKAPAERPSAAEAQAMLGQLLAVADRPPLFPLRASSEAHGAEVPAALDPAATMPMLVAVTGPVAGERARGGESVRSGDAARAGESAGAVASGRSDGRPSGDHLRAA